MNAGFHHRPPTDEEIAARARELWRLAGEPRDRDVEFWFAAQARIDREHEEIRRALHDDAQPTIASAA